MMTVHDDKRLEELRSLLVEGEVTRRDFRDAMTRLEDRIDAIERLRAELNLWQETCRAATRFIESHVADPDITDEMVRHYGAYQAAEERLFEYYDQPEPRRP